MKKKTKNKAIRYFFLTSVVFHALLLVYLGKSILEKRYERRIEVDLKSLASAKPLRSIPQPYRRPRAAPQSKPIKSPVMSLSPRQIISHAQIKAFESEKIFSPQATENIYSPLPASLSQSATDAQSALGVVGQINAVEIPQAPSAIKGTSDTFDQTLDYQGVIRHHIEEHKHYPLLATRRGLEGRVGLSFLLYRDGHVEKIEVTKSSRVSLLDEAAIRAVKTGNPFPPFPESILQDSMMIEITLSFELRIGNLNFKKQILISSVHFTCMNILVRKSFSLPQRRRDAEGITSLRLCASAGDHFFYASAEETYLDSYTSSENSQL